MSAPVFLADDVMTATVSPGLGQPALFAPEVSWWTAPDPVTNQPTQTGYDQAQVVVSIEGADTAQYCEPQADYLLQVWRLTSLGKSSCVWEGTLVSTWAPGVGRPRIPTYCEYQDMLDFGPWCRYVQDQDAVQAGFYSQRLEARLWLDDIIVRSFRASALYPFGTAAVPYQFWSAWSGPWRSTMPSIWIRDLLWGGTVASPVAVEDAGTGYTSEPLVTAPPPPATRLEFVAPRQKPARFVAVLDGLGGVGAVLVQDPGFGYVPGQPLTLSFLGGGGTGATAAATVVPGALFRRNQVRRLAAFKALSIVGLQQMGSNPQHLAFGEHFAARASEEIGGFVAELDMAGTGYPQISIPTGITNTVYI